ncbi:MAG TPA: MFS transporter [Halococcus sp.]|nr:MFS transporter [Halococcus sp.]
MNTADAESGSKIESESARVPWRSRTVQVVLMSTLLAPLGVPLVAPALPVIRDAFGVSDAQASLLVSAYFLTGIVLSPFIGLLTDRIGRKRVLVASLLTFALTGVAIVFAPDFTTVLALRVVQGTAAAGVFITTVTLIGDAFEGVQRNAVMGVNVAALSTGAVVFPVLGGALAAVAWNAPFAAYVLALPVGLFALRYVEEPARDREVRGVTYLRGAVETLKGRDALVLYGASFVTELLLFGTIVTALPFLLTAEYGLAPVVVGVVLTASEVSSVVVASQNGRLAERVSDTQLVALGFVCYGVALLGVWLAPSLLLVALAVAVFGVGLGLSMPAVDAGIAALVPARFRAGALSLRNSTTFLGRATGPILFAGLAVMVGYRPLLLAAAALAFGSGLFAILAGGPTKTIAVPEKSA